MWVEQYEKWIDPQKWASNGGYFSPEEMIGKPVVSAAIDLGSTADLTSLCLLFELPEGGYKALWWFWCPKDGARKRQERDRASYLDWADEGYLRLTEGDETDYSVIESDVLKIAETYGFNQIAIDRLFQGASLGQSLAKEGFDVIPFGQGFYSMAAPSQEFERLVNRGEFKHGDNKVMAWMSHNVCVKIDEAGCMKPDKKKSGEKIDGIVSAIMALGIALLNKEEPIESVYNTRGIISI